MIKKILSFFTCLMLSVIVANAYDVEENYNNNIITVSGVVEPNSPVTIIAAKAESTGGDLFQLLDPASLILFAEEITSDSTGGFSIDFSHSYGTDYINLFVTANNTIKEIPFPFVDKDDYNDVIDLLVNYANNGDYGNFKNTVLINDVMFPHTFKSYSSINIENAIKNFYNYVANNTIYKESKTNNIINFYKTFVVMEITNEGKEIKIAEELTDICVQEHVKKIVVDTTKNINVEQFFLNKIKGHNSKNIQTFENVLLESAIIAEIKYVRGYENAKKILQDNHIFLDISESASDDVYIEMAGREFANKEELKRFFDGLCTPKKDTSPSGSGGTGGGGAYTDKKFGVEIDNKENTPQNEPIKVLFDDIDGFSWANTAILALADMGVINGKSENRFFPADNITREEFTKIIVAAMGLKLQENTNSQFNDVSANQWYTPYINSAKSNGIVNGISSTQFGIGLNITRQDLAVMAYNAIRTKNNLLLNTEPKKFLDYTDISAYAKEAVDTLSSLGVINGDDTNSFRPLNFATRAEAAQIVYGILNHLR